MRRRPGMWRIVRMQRRAAAALCTLAVLCVLPAPASAAARVRTLAGLPGSVAQGATLKVRLATRPAAAPVKLLLSKDRRRDRHDVALRGVRRHGATTSGVVPASTTPGAYHLLACTGHACHASAGTVRVVVR